MAAWRISSPVRSDHRLRRGATADDLSEGARKALAETSVASLPDQCPFSLEQILDSGFLP
jgi:hypothetical protein